MLRFVLVFMVFINLIACSSTPEWKANYGKEKSKLDSSQLEVPPDLTEPEGQNSLALPTIASTKSTYLTYTGDDKDNGNKVAAANPLGVKVVRDGATQWLEIEESTEELWPKLKTFFKQVGFELKREDKALGVMETEWLENRAALPTNWFSNLLNRFSSTGLRDKYRARLEKTDNPKVSRLFITHQGLKEYASGDVYSGEAFKIWWQTRPSDPELEAEMYQRFLVFSDMSKADAVKLVNTAAAKERTRIVEKDGSKILEVNEGFARTWRRVGIALDRIGLLIDDRNRSNGLYYIRITDDFREKIKEEKNWLSDLFSSEKKDTLKELYLLNIAEKNELSLISIYEPSGAKADPRFVGQLLSELKLYLD